MSFMEKIHSHNRKLSFHLARVRIISLMEYKNTKMITSMIMHQRNIKLKKYYAEKFSETTGI